MATTYDRPVTAVQASPAGELDREDPTREVVTNGSVLRASLSTSVVGVSVAATAMGLGLVLVLVGVALRVLGRPQTA